MSDRELLELAAKAAGLNYDHDAGEISYGEAAMRWNPLENDGAALRLAVRLDLPVSSESVNGSDAYAATRRAIVMAAAEIGKAMTKD